MFFQPPSVPYHRRCLSFHIKWTLLSSLDFHKSRSLSLFLVPLLVLFELPPDLARTITSFVWDNLHWLSIQQGIQLMILTLMRNCPVCSAPSCFRDTG